MKTILISGTAGFIGYHLVRHLEQSGLRIIGIDNINTYYDVELKYARLKECGIQADHIEYGKPLQSKSMENYSFIKLDLEDAEALDSLCKREKPDIICSLAAQAGVRYSLTDPYTYIESNVKGMLSVMEAARKNGVPKVAYASSSSVYGGNEEIPFSIDHETARPMNMYAVSKLANEQTAYAYRSLYGIESVGLRFFTVYGPWGRPDMALFKFVSNITQNKAIEVYNNGNMRRDFTYIDDIVRCVGEVLRAPSWKEQVYNIGSSSPVALMDFINIIEQKLGKKAQCTMLPLQPGDIPETYADISATRRDFGFSPHVQIEEGVNRFIDWYLSFYTEGL